MSIEKIKLEIIKANKAYRKGNPIISDEKYDDLLSFLEDESPEEYEELRLTLSEEGGSIIHNFIIGSLNKIKYGEDSLAKWIKKHKPKHLIASEKIDGCSFVATYEDGKLIIGASRGDGTTGTDWTSKLKIILPKKISFKDKLVVRGELVLCDGDWQTLGYRNGRNGVVGMMNDDKLDPEKLKLVTAIVYDILEPESCTMSEIFSFLEKENFTIPKYAVFMRIDNTIDELLKETLYHYKQTSKYAMDGLVVCPTDYLNEDVYYPERKVAFKVNQDAVITTVIGIDWNTSKAGAVKPVLLLEPFDIDGVTIRRASAYNSKYLVKNGIGIGTKVGVIRSGDVIPKVVSVISNTISYKDINPISQCPTCKSQLVWKGVDLVCKNQTCERQEILKVTYFLRNCGIEGVTQVSLKKWNIENFSDLLSWDPDTNSRNQDKFANELSKMWSKTEDELFSLMIFDGSGQSTINKLYNFYGKEVIDAIMKQRLQPSSYPESIGQRTLDNLYDSWNINKEILKTIISDRRWKPIIKEEVKEEVNETQISGKSFCLTGTMSKKRNDIEKIIIKNGGIIASVNKKLDYLVVGDDAGSKLTKAESLGINIIDEAKLYSLIKG